jgi:hypothetical protein
MVARQGGMDGGNHQARRHIALATGEEDALALDG